MGDIMSSEDAPPGVTEVLAGLPKLPNFSSKGMESVCLMVSDVVFCAIEANLAAAAAKLDVVAVDKGDPVVPFRYRDDAATVRRVAGPVVKFTLNKDGCVATTTGAVVLNGSVGLVSRPNDWKTLAVCAAVTADRKVGKGLEGLGLAFWVCVGTAV